MQFLGIPRSKSTIFFFILPHERLIDYRKVLDHTTHFRGHFKLILPFFFFFCQNAFVKCIRSCHNNKSETRMDGPYELCERRLKIFSLLILVSMRFSFFSNLHSFCKYVLVSSFCSEFQPQRDVAAYPLLDFALIFGRV